MHTTYIKRGWLGLILFFTAFTAHAVLQIEITQGVRGATPIAIVPFGWEGPAPTKAESISDIISNDLRLSGMFNPLAASDFLSRPTDVSQINFSDWQRINADNLVIGKVQAVGQQYRVQFQLFDTVRGAQLAGLAYTVGAKDLRRVAHKISDKIYEALTGQPGAFSTRIAYITRQSGAAPKKKWSLWIADMDGANETAILKDTSAELMSPAWSPDGTRLAYVSFESGKPNIWVQELATGKRQLLFTSRDSFSAPAWSPDGKKIAFSLSKNGNRDIYIYSFQSRLLSTVTQSTGDAFTTEPAWSPDGNFIYYSSNRGGNAQIYKVSAMGGQPQRVTFEGTYNARPVLSPDGKTLAMVHSEGKGYDIAAQELSSGTLRVITNTGKDESPSFAPNGSMILYATRNKGRAVLKATSADGQVQQVLHMQGGADVLDPAWGPLNRD